MSKQKIVIKICMCCDNDKCRCKAMKLAAATGGVDSVTIDGKYRDEVVVIGDCCVDSVNLTTALRKKVCRARLLHVSEVVVNKDDKKPPPPAEAPSKPKPQPEPATFICHHYYHRVGYPNPCPWCGHYFSYYY